MKYCSEERVNEIVKMDVITKEHNENVTKRQVLRNKKRQEDKEIKRTLGERKPLPRKYRRAKTSKKLIIRGK